MASENPGQTVQAGPADDPLPEAITLARGAADIPAAPVLGETLLYP